jgi:presenilin-like A22 family membrane protease
LKYDLKTSLIILSLFFLTQIIGLYVISANLNNFDLTPEAEEAGSIPYILVVSIIIITVIFLVLIKLKLNKILIAWYSLAFVTCTYSVLASFINEFYAVIISLALLVLKFDSKDDFFFNMSEILVYSGLALLLVSAVDLQAMIILLLIISAYDIIAVNVSGHMVRMAKSQLALNIFSGFKIESNGSVAALGGGDVVFPLILAGVMLRDYSLLSAIIVAYGALIGLLVLILTGKENKAYPAMPYITLGCFLGLALNALL